MRRKLIPHGQSSMTISLPMHWVKNNHLTKGKEVDITEDDNNLVIRQINPLNEHKSIEVNFSKLNPEVMKKILLVLHRKNYDEIKIHLGNPSEAKSIQVFLNEMQLGFEVIKQEKEHVTIKSITNPEPEQFDNLFRRIFRIAIEYSRKIELVMADKEDRTYSCLLHETSINRISSYCKKIIIRERKQNACFYYAMLDNLSSIVGVLTSILDENQKNGHCFSNSFIEKYRELCSIFADTYDLSYKFNIGGYSDLYAKIDAFRSDILRLKIKNKGEQESFNQLIRMTDQLMQIYDSLLSLQF